jgi:pimeloyl-ACP methyl ester carboxylesterase
MLSLFMPVFSSVAEVGVGESSNFLVDTRYGFTEGSGISSFFTVDTRFSGSSSEGYSALFSVDTLGATTGTASITGQVKDKLGFGLAGTTVSALINNVVRAQVGTDGSGHYTLSGLPAASYTVRAEKASYLSGVRYGLALANGQSASQHFTLTALPGAPPVVDTTKPIETPRPIENSQLMRWVGNSWVTVTNTSDVNLAKQTVVMTHGWNSSATNAWPTNLATKMIAGGVTDANILAWNWSKNAKTGLLLSLAFSRTPGEGRKLAQTLTNVLGNSYTNGIHFIGHSLGTLVNAAAANYLHKKTGGAFDWQRTQMTLLDNAELANIEGRLYPVGYSVAGFESLLGLGDPPPLGWASPLPEQRAWADNYMSLVGLYHFSVVNVEMRQEAILQSIQLNPIGWASDAHSYACDWYAATAANPGLSILGNKYSFERLGENASFPSPSPYPAGSLFIPVSGNEYTLVNVGDAAGFIANRGADFLTTKVQDGVGRLVATGQKIGDVTVNVVESGVAVLEDVAQTVISLPVISLQAVLRSSGGSQLRMNNLGSGGGGLQNIENYTNSPIAVWLPIQVPTNAALLSFDFQFSGSAGEDVLSASINGTNVFALDAQDMPPAQLLNSGPIDVTQWAGQDVELFFGLLGGTSVNAELSIAGMRFYQIDPPLLTVAMSGGSIIVSWPATAAAYSLQSTTNLASPTWTAVTNAPTLSGMRQHVTHSVSGHSQFYRLKRE